MNRLIPLILTLILVFSLLAPLSVQPPEILSSHEQSSFKNKFAYQILKVSAIERFFPMENRFQSYKNGSLLLPEKLFISFGKAEGQNTFDIIADNMSYQIKSKRIEINCLSFQEQLSLNQLIHKEKKSDNIKVINSSI